MAAENASLRHLEDVHMKSNPKGTITDLLYLAVGFEAEDLVLQALHMVPQGLHREQAFPGAHGGLS
jgi:hypothetical protein